MSLRKQDFDLTNFGNSNRPSSFKYDKKNMSSTQSPIFDYQNQKSIKNSVKSRHNKNPQRHINQFEIGINNCCKCQQKIKSLTDRIQDITNKYNYVMLKIDQFGNLSNIQSTKYLQTFNRIINIQKKFQKIEYNVWELKQYSKQERNDIQKLNLRLVQMKEEGKRELQNSLFSFNVNSTDKKSLDELNKKVESYKNDHLKKLKGMHEALQDIAKLQFTFKQQLNDTKSRLNYLDLNMNNKQNLRKQNFSFQQNLWKTKY